MRIVRISLAACLCLVAACSKSDTSRDDAKPSVIDLAHRSMAEDSTSTVRPLLEARGFRIVTAQRVPAQRSGHRASATIYRSADGARGGVVYAQRYRLEPERVTWHWYFDDGAPDSIQFVELNDDGLWDVRVFMAGGSTRDFVQGEAFTLMTDRGALFAMNGKASAKEAWKAVDGDTATAWRPPAGAFIEIPLPMGLEEGELRIRVAGRAEKIGIFAGEKKVQEIALQRTGEFQMVPLDASLKDAEAIKVVVEGAAPVAISELELR